MNYMEKAYDLFSKEAILGGTTVLNDGAKHYLRVMQYVFNQTHSMDFPLLILAAEYWCDLLRKSAPFFDEQPNDLQEMFDDTVKKYTAQKEGDER